MSTLFASLLTTHVVLGLIGVIASFMVTFMLLKDELAVSTLKKASLTAFLAYIISWLSGGWYYWKYYGTVVKPVIMKGNYTWAHSVFMEAKEHVFLFLPFVTLCLMLIIWCAPNALATNSQLKKRTFFLSLMITILAIVVTLSGVLITGGAR
jgi:hypothetical protein